MSLYQSKNVEISNNDISIQPFTISDTYKQMLTEAIKSNDSSSLIFIACDFKLLKYLLENEKDIFNDLMQSISAFCMTKKYPELKYLRFIINNNRKFNMVPYLTKECRKHIYNELSSEDNISVDENTLEISYTYKNMLNKIFSDKHFSLNTFMDFLKEEYRTKELFTKLLLYDRVELTDSFVPLGMFSYDDLMKIYNDRQNDLTGYKEVWLLGRILPYLDNSNIPITENQINEILEKSNHITAIPPKYRTKEMYQQVFNSTKDITCIPYDI